MYKIENSYENNGVVYDGLRTISANTIGELPLGKVLVFSNDFDSDNYFLDTEFKLNDGVVIKKSLIDEKKSF